jgi:uncharacterized membrane protein
MAQVRRVVKEEAWNVLHTPALLRVGVAFLLGIVTGSIALGWMRWGFAALVGWDTIALTVLIMVWSQIWAFDCERTAAMSRREDETRATAWLLELAAATVSLVGVFYALQQASELTGLTRIVLTAAAMFTIAVSWILVNTVFTLRYAHLHFLSKAGGLDFHGEQPPAYRDFAYLAFTVGMTYQVSDTEVRDPAIRRLVLQQALLSYLFGAFIIAATINVVAGFVH